MIELGNTKRTIRLRDDPKTSTVDALARLKILTREIVGRDVLGDRVYAWSTFDDSVPVIAMTRRREVRDGVEIVQYAIEALWQGEDLPSTLAFVLTTGLADDPDVNEVFRVTEVNQNRARLTMIGERVT